MKLCDLTQSYAPTGGGIRTFIHAQRDALLATDSDEHLLIVPGPEDAVVREGRATTYTVRSPLVPGSSVYRLLLRSRRVHQILERERPDVVAVHCAYNLPWTALKYRDAHPGVRVVGFYMTDLPKAYVEPLARRLGGRAVSLANRLAHRYLARLYRRLDATVAISPELAKRLRAIGVPNARFVPLGADVELFHPHRRDPELRRRLGVQEGDLLLIYAGRLDREKRAALLVDAFERLSDDVGARLVLVGDGPQRSELARRAESNPRLTVLPFETDRSRLAALLASADMYVSAMPFETFGLSVVEAQACGLPVVGVAAGAMLDRVPEGAGVGRLARVDSPDDLARQIAEMSRTDLSEAGRRARRMVESELSWPATFRRVFEIYQNPAANPDRKNPNDADSPATGEAAP